ncbi:hypothetical protein [Peptococcus simiae]|uniref:hypothetical protein n=1 Tax=Peptococcus simiae TaxID=1643805 RepID=UPI0039802CEF
MQATIHFRSGTVRKIQNISEVRLGKALSSSETVKDFKDLIIYPNIVYRFVGEEIIVVAGKDVEFVEFVPAHPE